MKSPRNKILARSHESRLVLRRLALVFDSNLSRSGMITCHSAWRSFEDRCRHFSDPLETTTRITSAMVSSLFLLILLDIVWVESAVASDFF